MVAELVVWLRDTWAREQGPLLDNPVTPVAAATADRIAIADYYYDEASGIHFARAHLSRDHFEEALRNAPDLPANIRAWLADNAGRAFAVQADLAPPR